MGVLTQLSACSCSSFSRIMLQCTMRVSISVSLLCSQTVYSRIKFYLPALTILNASYLLRTRAKGSRSDYIIQVRLILMAHLRWRNNLREFQNLCWRLSSCLFPSALARLMCWRCSCIILPRLKTFMGSCP
jgi:hypothetical protein